MTISESASNSRERSTPRQVAIHIAYLLAGLMISRGAMLGNLSPFGASFAAAVPFSYMPAGLLGAAVGYLILTPINSFRYIAVIISVGALRWVLSEIKRISSSPWFAPAAAFLPVFATGVALSVSASSELTEISLCAVEAVVSAAGAYFMQRTASLCESRRVLSGFSAQELTCLIMTGCILLLSLSALQVGGVSVGRILAILIILLAARYGAVKAGAIAGIAAGSVFSLSDSGLLYLSAGYALAGLLGGLLAPLSKPAVALGSAACILLLSLSSRDSAVIFATGIEIASAALIFLLIPKSLGGIMTTIFSDAAPPAAEENVRRNVTMRLSHCSRALSDVSSCVNQVSDKLTRVYKPEIDWIYEKAAADTCARCGLKVFCNEKQQELTYDDFHRLSDILKERGYVKERDIEEHFLKRCCKPSELAFSINRSYKEYLALQTAQKRIGQIRSVVAGQFAGLSEILEDLSEEFQGCESFDTASAERVTEALTALGMVVIDCCVKKNLTKGMAVECEVAVNKKTAVSKAQITSAVSRACGRFFDPPTLSFAKDRARISLCERPLYDVEIGSSQHIAYNGDLCGDCLHYFNNGAGSTVAIVSDGMGTGGRAAVDSNMAVSIMSKLLKAGLSYDCALAVVNASLMIKSEDESLATLDVMDFNLFSGKAELMKAGACTTYIKKNGRLMRRDIPSLPIGILTEARFQKEAVTLSKDDMIVMVSDGVMTGSDDWIEKLILSCHRGSAQDLSTQIVEEAAKRRREHDDDITALVFRVVERV